MTSSPSPWPRCKRLAPRMWSRRYSRRCLTPYARLKVEKPVSSALSGLPSTSVPVRRSRLSPPARIAPTVASSSARASFADALGPHEPESDVVDTYTVDDQQLFGAAFFTESGLDQDPARRHVSNCRHRLQTRQIEEIGIEGDRNYRTQRTARHASPPERLGNRVAHSRN